VSAYLVPQYVHVCATREAAVLLDLRADRYHGLDREQARALSVLVEGWPFTANASEIDVPTATQFASDLALQGLLTQDAAHGKSATPVQLPLAEARLHEWNSDDWPVIRTAHVWKMMVAYVRAVISLRFHSFGRTVHRVERRKASRVSGKTSGLGAIRELTHVFMALRPFFYTASNQCLLDSLVLIEFLALHGQFPNWVIGVTISPFAAHSWVQVERYVLGVSPEHARFFTPILVI
jgi:hypothetical protein